MEDDETEEAECGCMFMSAVGWLFAFWMSWLAVDAMLQVLFP